MEPFTPAKDPSSIDRRGLVGVGELTTPRWARAQVYESESPEEPSIEEDPEDYVVSQDIPEDVPDSPWTIEAIDGEEEERFEVRHAR